MRLDKLCAGWVTAPAVELTGLTADSRQVEPGFLFVALPFIDRPGFKHDGHQFLAQAVERGAAAVLVTNASAAARLGLPVVVVPDTRWLLPRLAARFYGQPSHELQLVGVTGTNGKTTICYLIESIFQAAGWQTVLAGTVETRVAGERRAATNTTPDPVTLQRLWRDAVDRGVTAGTMEVSSHSLSQHRVEATRYAVGVFTNLTQDHLDYHRTMEDYFQAKARLFAADETGWQPRAVLNGDDEYGRLLLAGDVREPLVYGLHGDAQVKAEDIGFDARGSRFKLLTPVGQWEQKLRIVGLYNVSNALAAVASALALGLPPDVIRPALERAVGAPGRLEPVDEGQSFAVLVDYAHTPDALANALTAVRQLTSGRVFCVFGCGGDRDRTKRPRMGRLAADLADQVVVTSDNPRSEDPRAILDDILSGFDAQEVQPVVEVDRRAAIGWAIRTAGPGDVVLIAGKGHETYQLVGQETLHFDDREVAREWLQGMA